MGKPEREQKILASMLKDCNRETPRVDAGLVSELFKLIKLQPGYNPSIDPHLEAILKSGALSD